MAFLPTGRGPAKAYQGLLAMHDRGSHAMRFRAIRLGSSENHRVATDPFGADRIQNSLSLRVCWASSTLLAFSGGMF